MTGVLGILLLLILYFVYDWWKRRKYVEGMHKKAVFLTGCDTGFGNAVAKSLYRRGVPVYAACLTEAGAKALQQETGERLKTVIVDVTNSESVLRAAQYVKQTLANDQVLWGVFNNAGIGSKGGPVEFLTADDFREVMDVNLYGMLEVTNAFLPLLKKSKGRIVNMCSLASELPFPNHLPYCASKFAAKGFSQTLRVEKSIWGISVSAIEPSFYKTNLANIESFRERIERAWNSLSDELREEYGKEYVDDHVKAMNRLFYTASSDWSPVVADTEHALFSVCPKATYYPGIMTKVFTSLPRWLMDAYIAFNTAVPKCLKAK